MKMFLSGIFLGVGFTLLACYVVLEAKRRMDMKTDELIGELLEENEAYKKALQNWRNSKDEDYWG